MVDAPARRRMCRIVNPSGRRPEWKLPGSIPGPLPRFVFLTLIRSYFDGQGTISTRSGNYVPGIVDIGIGVRCVPSVRDDPDRSDRRNDRPRPVPIRSSRSLPGSQSARSALPPRNGETRADNSPKEARDETPRRPAAPLTLMEIIWPTENRLKKFFPDSEN